MKFHVYIAVVMAGLCVCCATVAPLGAVDPAVLPGAAEYPEHGAVVLRHEETLTYSLGNDGEPQSTETVRHRVRLLSESGRRHAQVFASYNKTFSRIENFMVQVTAPDGEVTVIRQGEATDVPSAPGFVLFTDSRVVTVRNDSIPVGSVVDFTYTKVDTAPTYWTHRFIHQDLVPVVHSRFEVRTPPGWTLDTRHRQGNRDIEPTHVTTTDQGLIYERKHVDPPRSHAHAPPLWSLAPQLLVRLGSYVDAAGNRQTPFATFAELSRFEGELAAPQVHVTEGIKAKAAEILRGAPPLQSVRARKLYTWVRDNITYCAIEVGIGGWQPHASSETFEVGYGDCKDKANLLRSLLRADGIDSKLASIYSHRGYPRDSVLPTLGGNYNHAILVVETEEGRVVTDPTTRLVPFGQLPFNDQGAHLLVNSREGEDLVRTALSTPEQNRTRYDITATPHPDGSIERSIAFEAHGETARLIRGRFLSFTDTQRDEAVARLWGVDKEHVKSVQVEAIQPQEMIVPVKGIVSLHSPEPAVVTAGTAKVVRLSEVVGSGLPDIRGRDRDVPILLREPRRSQVVTRLVIAPDWTVATLPPAFEAHTDELDVSLTFTQEEGSVCITRDLVVKRPWVEPPNVGAYVDLVTALHEKERAAITLTPTTP